MSDKAELASRREPTPTDRQSARQSEGQHTDAGPNGRAGQHGARRTRNRRAAGRPVGPHPAGRGSVRRCPVDTASNRRRVARCREGPAACWTDLTSQRVNPQSDSRSDQHAVQPRVQQSPPPCGISLGTLGDVRSGAQEETRREDQADALLRCARPRASKKKGPCRF